MKNGQWRNGSKPKVSVIIPVYNAEEHLPQCLDSVVNQTLKDIEIICVDDGSTDNSSEILREYKTKDKRVHVLTQKNQYAGVARNHGMEQAQGEYYIFLDADDFFELNMLEAMYKQAVSCTADICLCGADRFYTQSRHYEPMPWMLNLQEVREQPFSVFDLKDIYKLTQPAPWNKLFSAEFVYKTALQFQNTPRINDMYFTYSALALAEKIVYVNEPFVHYRVEQRTNLQSGVYKTPEVCCEVLLAIKQRLQEEPCWKQVQDSFVIYAISNINYNFGRIKDHPEARRRLAGIIEGRYLKTLGIQDCTVESINDRKALERLQLTLFEAQCDDPTAPSVSLVVPVYNVEQHLKICISSLMNQSLKNIEIICVDDASQDDSLQVLRDYAARDSRIKLIEKEKNEGILCARKTGVLNSTGRYIMFVDSDDYLEPDACETAYQTICESRADILQFTCGVEDYSNNEEAKKWLEKYLKANNHTLNQRELQESFFQKRNVATALVGKIYYAPKCKLTYLSMPDIYCNIGEDLFQQFYLSCFADSFVGMSTKPLYWYRRGLGISNASIMRLDKYEGYCRMAELYQQLKSFAETQSDPEFVEECAHALGVRMCEDCARNWNRQIAEDDKAKAFEVFWNYWAFFQDYDEIVKRMTGRSARELYSKFLVPEYVQLSEKYGEGTSIKPRVSVIIPIYDVEAFLRECLDSIVKQTLEDIEIICVNDGSSDNSLSIVEEYRANDARMTVISQANGGLSAARNSGIRYAHGDFIYFIDSDDYLDLTALEKTFFLATKDNLDVVFFGIKAFYSSDEMQRTHSYESYYNNKEVITGIRSGVEYLQMAKDKNSFITTVWRGLWRRSLLADNQILFKEGIIHEDNLFSFQAIIAADRVLEIPDIFYHRRVRPDSIMTRRPSYKNVIGYFTCAEGILDYMLLHADNPEKERISSLFLNELLNAAKNIYTSLPDEEKSQIVFKRVADNELFRQIVGSDAECKRLWKELEVSNNECNRLRWDLDCVHASVSFRVGRVITWLPRKIRGGVKCYAEHGFQYTLRRFFEHLAGKVE